MSKRDLIKQKIDALNLELKRLKEQEQLKIGEFMIDVYQKKDWDLDKIKSGIAKILGDVDTDSKANDKQKPVQNGSAIGD